MNVDDLKSTLALTASVSTIIQFLSGILMCQKIVKKGSTGDISPLPFISGCLSTGLWLRYGFAIGDTSLIFVNTVGATLFFAYVVVFILYSIKKSSVIRQFLGCMLLLTTALLYCQYEENRQQAMRHLGLLCCFVTLMFFASPLATIRNVFNARSTDSLPFPIIFATFIVCIQWLFYGILLGDKFIQIPNFLGCLLSGFQLSLFCIFREKHSLLEDI